MANSICDGISIEEREEMRRAEMREILGETPQDIDDMDTEETVEETSRNHIEQPAAKNPLPTKQRPATIFVTPAPASEDDDDDGVEAPVVREPSEEVRQETSTSFSEYLGRRPTPEVLDEDDYEEDPLGNDEEDEHVVLAYAREGTEFPDPDMEEDNDSDEDEDESDDVEDESDSMEPVDEEDATEEELEPVEPKITYSVVNYDPKHALGSHIGLTDSGTFPGILMHIEGDFEEAFKEYGLSLYVKIGDDSTITQAISAEVFRKILADVVPEIIEEQEAYERSRKAYY